MNPVYYIFILLIFLKKQMYKYISFLFNSYHYYKYNKIVKKINSSKFYNYTSTDHSHRTEYSHSPFCTLFSSQSSIFIVALHIEINEKLKVKGIHALQPTVITDFSNFLNDGLNTLIKFFLTRKFLIEYCPWNTFSSYNEHSRVCSFVRIQLLIILV